MACFLVPTAEAIVTTVITKAAKAGESSAEISAEAGAKSGAGSCAEAGAKSGAQAHAKPARMPFIRKLRWLSNLCWGGAVLLCFEHLWHGEVVPFPPFLTAASNPADTAAMLHEMATAGVCMACLVTAVWIGMVIVSNAIEKRSDTEDVSASQEV